MYAQRAKQPISHKGEKLKPPEIKDLSVLKLTDRVWRLDNLYHVVNKHGKLVRFRLRPIQRHFLENLWYRNVILKSRQLGFTTLIDLLELDTSLFVPNTQSVIIAHRKDDAAAIMEHKIEVPYANLHPAIREMVPVTESNKTEMRFANGSGIRVTTSGRSGTAQMLHVSELGFTSKHRPDTASEIVTGSFPAVHQGSFIFVESTAEGSSGEFHSLCMTSLNKKRERRRLTPIDFKFHFYAWHDDADNALSDEDTAEVVVVERLTQYFDQLEEKLGITLSANQRAWYASQEDLFQDKMKQENPSYPEEAFEHSGEGRYFRRQMNAARESGRITVVPHQEGRLVHLFFDIGVNDPTAVWFMQPAGPFWHALHYYENTDNGIAYHITRCREIAQERGFVLGEWVGPHDVKQRARGTGISTLDEAAKNGVRFEVVPRVSEKIAAIDVARRMISVTRFDEEHCAEGVKRLDNYSKRWDKTRGTWADQPLHDEHSDGADAYQCFAAYVEGQDLESRLHAGAQADPRNAKRTTTALERPDGGRPQPAKRTRMRAFT